MNTFAPDSVAPPTSFGVWISVKPGSSRTRRNPRTEAAAIRQSAWRVRWRQTTGAWSSTVGSPTSRAGRHSCTGGVAAGALSAVTCGLVELHTAGCLLVARSPCPSTAITVSSGRASSDGARRSARPAPHRCGRARAGTPPRPAVDGGAPSPGAAPAARSGRATRRPSVRNTSTHLLGPRTPGGVGDRELAVPPHLHRPRGSASNSQAARRSSRSSTPLPPGYGQAATLFRPCATGRPRRRRRGRRAAGGVRRPGPRP